MRKSVCIIFLMIGISLSAQNVAVKTNLLYDATTTFNLGAEIGLSPRWTLDLSANYNPFSFSDNKKWKHYPKCKYECDHKHKNRNVYHGLASAFYYECAVHTLL